MRMRSLKALSSSLDLASSLYYRAGVLYSRRRRRSNTTEVSDHARREKSGGGGGGYLLRERGVFVGEILGVVPEFLNGVEQRTQVNCTRSHTRSTQHDTHHRTRTTNKTCACAKGNRSASASELAAGAGLRVRVRVCVPLSVPLTAASMVFICWAYSERATP
jgi:hypothetical protein